MRVNTTSSVCAWCSQKEFSVHSCHKSRSQILSCTAAALCCMEERGPKAGMAGQKRTTSGVPCCAGTAFPGIAGGLVPGARERGDLCAPAEGWWGSTLWCSSKLCNLETPEDGGTHKAPGSTSLLNFKHTLWLPLVTGQGEENVLQG